MGRNAHGPVSTGGVDKHRLGVAGSPDSCRDGVRVGGDQARLAHGLAAAFLAAGFFAEAAFLAAGFLAAALGLAVALFLAAGFLVALAALGLAAAFLVAVVFFVAVALAAAGFLAAGFLAEAGFLAGAFLGAAFLAGGASAGATAGAGTEGASAGAAFFGVALLVVAFLAADLGAALACSSRSGCQMSAGGAAGFGPGLPGEVPPLRVRYRAARQGGSHLAHAALCGGLRGSLLGGHGAGAGGAQVAGECAGVPGSWLCAFIELLREARTPTDTAGGGGKLRPNDLCFQPPPASFSYCLYALLPVSLAPPGCTYTCAGRGASAMPSRGGHGRPRCTAHSPWWTWPRSAL